MDDGPESLPSDVDAPEDATLVLTAKQDVFRSPRELLARLEFKARSQLFAPLVSQVLLALSGGSLMTFGALLSVTLSEGVAAQGPARVLSAVGFLSGFIAVFITSSVFFTEINIMLPQLMLNRPTRPALLAQLRFWGIVWCFNVIGALFCATLLSLSGVIRPPVANELLLLLQDKMRYRDSGAAGWFQVVLSAALCNWAVGLSALGAAKSRIIVSTVFVVFFPVLTFAGLGLQHTMANLGLFFTWLTYSSIYGIPSPGVSWGDAFGWSIVPSSLGNLLGGICLVAMVFHFAFTRPWCCRSRDKVEAPPRTGPDPLDSSFEMSKVHV